MLPYAWCLLLYTIYLQLWHFNPTGFLFWWSRMLPISENLLTWSARLCLCNDYCSWSNFSWLKMPSVRGSWFAKLRVVKWQPIESVVALVIGYLVVERNSCLSECAPPGCEYSSGATQMLVIFLRGKIVWNAFKPFLGVENSVCELLGTFSICHSMGVSHPPNSFRASAKDIQKCTYLRWRRRSCPNSADRLMERQSSSAWVMLNSRSIGYV